MEEGGDEISSHLIATSIRASFPTCPSNLHLEIYLTNYLHLPILREKERSMCTECAAFKQTHILCCKNALFVPYLSIKVIASSNQRKKQEQFKERIIFIVNFQRELTNFLYYDRISIL